MPTAVEYAVMLALIIVVMLASVGKIAEARTFAKKVSDSNKTANALLKKGLAASHQEGGIASLAQELGISPREAAALLDQAKLMFFNGLV